MSAKPDKSANITEFYKQYQKNSEQWNAKLKWHDTNDIIHITKRKNKTASMSAALKLTQELSKIFPEDPLKGDFALFGYGVNNKNI